MRHFIISKRYLVIVMVLVSYTNNSSMQKGNDSSGKEISNSAPDSNYINSLGGRNYKLVLKLDVRDLKKSTDWI